MIRALLHFQGNPMLYLRILFSANFAWQNSCRIVAQFLRKKENLKLRTQPKKHCKQQEFTGIAGIYRKTVIQ